jgi:rod shape-determining protein MreC
VRLAADYERLDFLRVLRSRPAEPILDPGGLLRPPVPFGPDLPEPVAEAEGGADG